jgi:hypothetical protein
MLYTKTLYSTPQLSYVLGCYTMLALGVQPMWQDPAWSLLCWGYYRRPSLTIVLALWRSMTHGAWYMPWWTRVWRVWRSSSAPLTWPSKTDFVVRDEGRIYMICGTTILLLALICWIAGTIVGNSSSCLTTMKRKIGVAAHHANDC